MAYSSAEVLLIAVVIALLVLGSTSVVEIIRNFLTGADR